MAGVTMLAVNGITANVHATPKPLRNYRPAFESIVLGKPIAPQDQELVATISGIKEKLDTHSREKGVQAEITAIQVDFATRINNNIVRMGLENLDFLVTTVPKEHLPRLLEICHGEMLANPDRADAIPRVLGNIHLLNGRLSDGSIRQMMRTGFGRSTSLCPKEVSAVLKTEYDSGRLDHIEGVAETRAVQGQEALPMLVLIPTGTNTIETRSQELIVATNNTVYHPIEIVDAMAVIQLQSPYSLAGQIENGGYNNPESFKSEPPIATQVVLPVQIKSEQSAEPVQTKADILPLVKMPQKYHTVTEQTTKEENLELPKVKKQKRIKASAPIKPATNAPEKISEPKNKKTKKTTKLGEPDTSGQAFEIASVVKPNKSGPKNTKNKKTSKPTNPKTSIIHTTAPKPKTAKKKSISQFERSWLNLLSRKLRKSIPKPEKEKHAKGPKPVKKGKEKPEKKIREKKPIKTKDEKAQKANTTKAKIKEKSVNEIKDKKIKVPKERKKEVKSREKVAPKDTQKVHTNKKTWQDSKKHIKPKAVARKSAKKIQLKRKQRIILKIILGKRRPHAKSRKRVSRKRT